jgi:hypothetical protein
VLDARVQPDTSGVRCPLCLGELGAAQPPAVSTCPDCATTYHAACVQELGVPCATLGCARGPKPPVGRPADTKPPPPLRLRPGLLVTALFFLAPIALVTLSRSVQVTRAAPERGPPEPPRRRDPVVVRLPGAPDGPLLSAEEARAAFVERGTTLSVALEPPQGAKPGRLLVPREGLQLVVEVPAEVFVRAVGPDPAPTRSVRAVWLDERTFLMAARGGVLKEALLCDLQAGRAVALLDLSLPW